MGLHIMLLSLQPDSTVFYPLISSILTQVHPQQVGQSLESWVSFGTEFLGLNPISQINVK